jgi:hypothetical protein
MAGQGGSGGGVGCHVWSAGPLGPPRTACTRTVLTVHIFGSELQSDIDWHHGPKIHAFESIKFIFQKDR